MNSSQTLHNANALQIGCPNALIQKTQRELRIFISRSIRFVLLFAYLTAPVLLNWIATHTGLYTASSTDLLVAMAWMPIGSAITALSFMKFGWKHAVKGSFAFIALNALAITCLVSWYPF